MSFDPTELRRSDFPWTSQTSYLDSASIGPLPARSLATLDAFNALRATPHRISKDVQFGALTRARSLAARLLNASVEEIALATNTSFGLNIAARALPLEPGDIVLLSDREFPANVYPWMKRAEGGVQLEMVPVTAEGWPDEARLLERLADPRVRVLAVSLVQFSNGYTIDLAAVSEGRASDRDMAGGRCHPGIGPDARRSRGDTRRHPGHRSTEVAAVTLGQRLLLRAEGDPRAAQPTFRRLARLSGHRRLQQSHPVQSGLARRCASLRARSRCRSRTSRP